MQKKLIAMAVAGLLAAPAFAQTSSVQLYGRVDMGTQGFTNDGKGQTLNQESSNRWGIMGSEDLGNGWRAFFQLENRFFLDTGTQDGTRQWKDKAFVGLGSKTFGDLSMGRVQGAAYSVYGDTFTAFGGDTIAANVSRRGMTVNNWSNAVRYVSPSIYGITLIGTYGLAEGSGSSGVQGSPRYGVAAQMRWGGFASDVVYQKDTTTDAADGSLTTTANGTLVAASAQPFKTLAGTLGYNFGFMQLFGGYAFSRSYALNHNNWIAQNTPGIDAKDAWFESWQVGTKIPLGAGLLQATYGHSQGKYVSATGKFVGAKGQYEESGLSKIGLGYWYNLSKRTILMANFAYLMQDKAFSNAKDDSFGYEFAVRHSF